MAGSAVVGCALAVAVAMSENESVGTMAEVGGFANACVLIDVAGEVADASTIVAAVVTATSVVHIDDIGCPLPPAGRVCSPRPGCACYHWTYHRYPILVYFESSYCPHETVEVRM